MDVTQLDLPDWLIADRNCLFLVEGACHHGANPLRRENCRKYCTVSSMKWLKSTFDHLDEETIQRYAIRISELG